MCFLGTNLGLFSMQQAGKGQFIELTSILDLVLIHKRRYKEIHLRKHHSQSPVFLRIYRRMKKKIFPPDVNLIDKLKA